MENVVTEETSYAESDVSGLDDNMNNTTLRKMHICTYVLNNIELSAVLGKTNSDKLVSIKKIFIMLMVLGRASTPSKFPEIIRSTFTLEASMNKAKSLAVSGKILVNNKLRKVNSHSNWEIVVKKISVDLPKLAVESALVEFKSAKIAGVIASKWSVLMDQHQALLYTLPVRTMAHNLSDLLESYDGKTCFIGRNSVSYICNRYTTVCFNDEATRLAAIGSVPVFKGVSLHWANLFLACCAKCKHFGHVSDMCSVDGFSGGHGKKMASVYDQVCLANIYKKRHAPVARPVSFGSKSWIQVASLAAPSGAGAQTVSGSGALVSSASSTSRLLMEVPDVSCIVDHLAVLEWFFELLSNRVSKIVHRLNGVDLVPLVPVSSVVSFVVSAPFVMLSIQNMALNSPFFSSHSSSSVPVL
ncbi:hypothetical protein G9A89_008741 [Geosiphon pyriformis]|nr:hypothetical protein G9A89_008741 [Geosiphon pyriformis]